MPGKVPDAANVAVGELAVNLVDQRLYTKDGSGNIFLLGAGNTDRLIEGTANLFYTNTRARSAISAGDTTIIYDSANGTIRANISALGANVISVNGQTGVVTLSTFNISESGNLYYTNARVRSALTSGNGISYNTTTGNITLSPSGVLESTYGGSSNVGVFTVDQFGRITSASNVAVAGVNGFSATGNSFTITTSAGSSFTANIQPDSVRLGIDTTGDYVKNVIAGTSIVITNQGGEDATPTISTSQALNENSSPTFYNLTVSGNLSVIGNVTYITSNVFEVNDPLIYLAGNNYFSDIVDIGFVGNYYDGNLQRHAGLFRDASDGGKFKLFANLNPEPGDIIDTANSTFRYADLVVNTLTGDLIGTVTSLSNHNTSNLSEGTNLYYTNARVYSNISPLLTTANVSEVTNLYYTNSRVDSYVTPKLTTANVVETTNLYYSNSRVYSNIAPLLTTANVAEVNNLYYTNARVYSNVISLLPNYTGNIGGNLIGVGTNTTIIAGSYLYSFLNTGETQVPNLRANIIYANVIQGVTTTSIAEGSNLYYTNARVYSNVSPLLVLKANVSDLTTSNVTEGTNLYYTNARVRSAISAANGINYNQSTGLFTSGLQIQLVDTANVALNTVANVNTIQFDYDSGFDLVDRANGIAKVQLNSTFKYWNVLGQANLVASGLDTVRFIPTNNIEITLNTNATPQSITFGANLIEYAKTVSLTTANVTELNNLYYTNARVDSYVTPKLTTANVIETSNLYFTNARVIAALVGQDVVLDDLIVQGDLTVNGNVTTLNTATLVVEDKNIVLANGAANATAADGAGITIDGASANIKYLSSSDRFDINKNLVVLGNVVLTTGSTTSDLPEGANLYYTNARARSSISAGTGISYNSTTGVITADNSNSFLIGRLFAGEYIGDNTTTNYNLNFNPQSANAVLLFVDSILQTPDIDYTLSAPNVIVFTSAPETNANIVYRHFSSTNIDLNLGNLGDVASYLTASANSILVYNGTLWEPRDVSFLANTTYIIEGTNLYYTNSRVRSAISVTGSGSYDQANGIITVTGGVTSVNGANGNVTLSTTNISEGSNLYYTNTRVRSAISVTGSGSYDQANGIITVTGGVISVNGANGAVVLSTANVSEVSNLYYTNARVYSNISPLLTTANVSEVSNLYYTNARVYSNVISLLPNYTGNIGGNIVGTDSNTLIIAGNYVYSFLNTGEVQVPNVRANILYANIIQGATTSNIAEGSNLYYTNARVYSAITGNLVLKANVSDLTTSNVVEGANLYYTNARVDARIALANIRDLLDVSSNTPSLGQSLVWSGNIWHPETITGGGGGGSNIILVGEQTSAFFYGDNTTTNFNLGFNPYNDNNIMVFVDGINQISPNNYTVSGQTLIFDEAPATNTVVAVRYFAANSVYNTKFFLGTATNQEFVGDGSNVNFQISGIAGDSNQTFVFVNGVIQQPSYNYSITNSTLTFTSAPDSGANIFVRTFSNSQNELDLGQLKNVSNTAPATGQALTWTGNVWAPATLSSNVAAYQKYRYIATASQTVFTGADDSTQILVIPSTQRMQVHLNGVMLEPTLDYTANGSAVTLVLGAEAGDILSVGTFVDLGQGFAVDSFTANGSNTNFSLSRVPNGGASLLVSLNGLKQHQTEFTISGTTLSFNNAPPANTAIEVTHMGNAPIATVIEQWAEISGNATAAPGYKYIVNTSAVPAFINMPPNPRLGDTVYFLDGTSSFDVNKLTLLRNGSKIMGLNEHFESDIEDSYFGFVYFNTTYGWRLLN